MSTHIEAEPGQIAPRVLMPGDPLRAQWIAETYLDDASCYSRVRNMLGFTGTYRGEPVSVQGSGMGQPSLAIYANELFREYGVQQLVRVGSCGALAESLRTRDIVLAMSAATDSSMNRLRFHGLDYAATADFWLLQAAHGAAASRAIKPAVGQILSTDTFYNPRPELVDLLAEHGVLAIEMEANALYTLAASYGRRALAICTVSDHIRTGESLSAADRERSLGDMVEIALEAMIDRTPPEVSRGNIET
ncbi:MAG TPA: purine-nucleoside phosphorylase [Nocardioidaceae bacterium]|nr:purine-nucleoside phosphorylase [Nocardioidaceae bacterium]